MQKPSQLNLADQFFHPGKHKTRTAEFLSRMNQVIDWQPLVDIVGVLDRSGTKKGGRPRHDMLVMIKSMFLQHFYGLSDPQLEELLNDRLSFRFRVTSY